jgi:hypothetical protein
VPVAVLYLPAPRVPAVYQQVPVPVVREALVSKSASLRQEACMQSWKRATSPFLVLLYGDFDPHSLG